MTKFDPVKCNSGRTDVKYFFSCFHATVSFAHYILMFVFVKQNDKIQFTYANNTTILY